MDRPIIACVLAGGIGSRLYPASRATRPKQFLALGGERSLLSRTMDRTAFADERYVLTRDSFADDIHDHAPEAGVLVEPDGKDTGPALVYAAWRLRERFETEPVLVCLPSDHHVDDEAAFATRLERAAEIAVETDGLVTLGVEPTRPSTGYGYVVPSGSNFDGDSGADYAAVERFTEKPDREDAARLLESGAYWNAGVFAWTPGALLEAARDSPLAPLVAALEAGDPARGFDAVDPVSMDYAIMEHATDVFVTPLSVEWDDLGTWDAVGRTLETDIDADADDPGAAANDAVAGDILSIDAANNVVAAPDSHVSLLEVEDLIVAAYDDRILVAPRDSSQRVRDAVARLRERDLF
ncbi:mannose-1-phosphate guanylyltransferase [Natrinema versiforme]|uniref:Mannose-1-phosphate guanylyltransferase (GDP) n=1 Tax=Natrinema versiforme JCM 10478 TaxID=1227496 RepID=L9YBU0_9EURY|nr:mannose-1-phosphate guanylyltransferase [Natrinema versiforme]ELY71534.1 mannose-1-phosphate guanylyltransferase (GDP) [Natrinema versiforme JCM 10478]